MIGSDVLRALLTAGAGVVIAIDGPAAAVYALVSLATIAGTVFRPAQAALLPSLVRDPRKLSAANVVSSTVGGVGSFAGPAVGGALLAFTEHRDRLPRQRAQLRLVGRAHRCAADPGARDAKPVEESVEVERESFVPRGDGRDEGDRR